MSVFFKIPHTARYIATSTEFVGTFNVPTPGVYDFGNAAAPVAANTNVRVLQYKANTAYLIERMSVGGNLGEETYLDSLQTVPLLAFKREKGKGTSLYERPIPFVQFVDSREIAVWTWSDKSDDWLTLSLTGVLNQVAATVGKPTIRLFVGLSIFAVDSNWYQKNIRAALKPNIGGSLRGGRG